MTYIRIAISFALGICGVLTVSFIVSLFVLEIIYSIPAIKSSSGDVYVMVFAVAAISLMIHLAIEKTIFNKFLHVNVPFPFRSHSLSKNQILAYGGMFLSMGVAFYFRDYTFNVLGITAADANLSVSWLLSTVFLFRIFVLIAVYNEQQTDEKIPN